MSTPAISEGSDRSTLQQLHEQYIAALLKADVGWYSEYLAEDFLCINSDGAVRDKRQFLKDVAAGPEVKDYKLQDVHVRFYGRAALVQAKGVFTRKDGSPGQIRSTDVYMKTAGDKKVHVMGGASVVQQILEAGLADELLLHVAPVLLDSGTRLFEQLGGRIQLERLEVVQSRTATHLRYRVVTAGGVS
jgi:hypothetical protein